MYKVLISGFGSIGKRHASNLKALGCTVSIYDPGQRDHISLRFDDSLKAVSHVVIASPARFHAEQAIAAIEAGKHVFIEKPMATTVEEGEAIVKAAMQSDKSIAVGYQWRSHSQLIALRTFVRDFRLPISVHLSYSGNKNGWPGDCYDDLLLECSHELDFFRWLAGRDVDVKIKSVNVKQNHAGMAYGSDGFEAYINLDWKSSVHDRTFEASGANGRIVWSFDERSKLDKYLLSQAYEKELTQWLDENPDCTVCDGLIVLKDIDEIRECQIKKDNKKEPKYDAYF